MFWKNKELEELRKTVERLAGSIIEKEIYMQDVESRLNQKFKHLEEFVMLVLSQEQNKRIGLGAKIIEMQGILNNKPIETDQAFEIAMHCDNNSLELPIKNKTSEKKKRSLEECHELPKELKS